MKIKLFFVFTSFFVFSYSQIPKNSNLLIGIEEKQNLTFHRYKPFLKIFKKERLDKAKLQYPEGLMQSVLSATSKEWADFNELQGESEIEESHFNEIKKMNPKTNYFELCHKLVFKVGEIETCMIKFFLIQENEDPVSGCYIMQKKNGLWKLTSHPSLSNLSIMIMRIKSDVLEGVILGNSNDSEVIKMRKRVSSSGVIDTSKMVKEFESWYDEGNEFKQRLFKDPKTW